MIRIEPDTENTQEVMENWLESLAFGYEVVDVEHLEGAAEWTISFKKEDGDMQSPSCQVSWISPPKCSLDLRMDIELDDDDQDSFARMGNLDRLFFIEELVDCAMSHAVHMDASFEKDMDDENADYPLPTYFSLRCHLLADDGISRRLFFDRYNLLRSVSRRFETRFYQMHLMRKWL